MKSSPLFLIAALGALFAATNRVVSGTVNLRADMTLPPDAVVVVRVVDPSGAGLARVAANQDLPVLSQPTPSRPVEQVLGEQTIPAAVGPAVPFRIEYQADDTLLRHGLNIEARITFGGRVQFRTANAHVLTLTNSSYPHEVWVEAAR